MSGKMALALESAARKVGELECALRVYAVGCPAAAARVAAQLEAARAELARLQEGIPPQLARCQLCDEPGPLNARRLCGECEEERVAGWYGDRGGVPEGENQHGG